MTLAPWRAAPSSGHTLRAGFVSLALALGGCSSDVVDSDAAACNANGAMVYMGGGVDGTLSGFQRLMGNDPVYLNVGTQGLQHIWIGLRASGISPTQPRVQLQAFRVSDGASIGLIRVRLPMSPAPGNPSLYGLPSQTLILDDAAYCSVLPGDVRVQMDFDDGAGHCVTQSVVVHLTGINPSTPSAVAQAETNCCTMHQPRCFPDDDAATPSVDASIDANGSGM